MVLPLALPPAGSYQVLVEDWGLHTALVVQPPPGWRRGPLGAEAAEFLMVAWGDFLCCEKDGRCQALIGRCPAAAHRVGGLAGAPPRYARLRVARREQARQVDVPTLHC